jgi:hypothetical protein
MNHHILNGDAMAKKQAQQQSLKISFRKAQPAFILYSPVYEREGAFGFGDAQFRKIYEIVTK